MTIGDARRGIRKLTKDKPRNTTDQLWWVECDCGQRVGWTKVSKQPDGTQLGVNLVGRMARQLEIPVEIWKAIAACSVGRADYLRLRHHGH